MDGLTLRQQQILDFMRQWHQEKGYAPSLREIAAHFKINVTSTANHVKALTRKGALQRNERKSRALRFEQAPINIEEGIPLIGVIPAGAPLAVEDQVDERLHVTPAWFSSQTRAHKEHQLVALRVMGDSMEGDAILDGDFAIIKLQQEAPNGTIVAVRVEGSEITLKRIRLKQDMVELVPSNPNHPIRTFPADHVEIIGILAGVVRKSLNS